MILVSLSIIHRHVPSEFSDYFVFTVCEIHFSGFIEAKGPGKRGHIVADTLLPVMFLWLRKLGNICCGHKMFLNKIRNIFCVPDTKFVSATNVARAGKRGNFCVGNNVSSFARAFCLFYWSLGAETTNITCWDQNSFQVRAFLSSCSFFTIIQSTES